MGTLRTFITLLAHGPRADDGHVHFHRGPQGQAAACHDRGCPMPRLSV
jgi:hypothetical protein